MKPSTNPVRLIVEVLLVIAVAEWLVMSLLPIVAPDAKGWTESLIDVIALLLLSAPILFWRMSVHWHNHAGTDPKAEMGKGGLSLGKKMQQKGFMAKEQRHLEIINSISKSRIACSSCRRAPR